MTAPMDESAFNRRADAMLARIEESLADEADIDVELQAGGVLALEFANGSKIVINRHGAAREIWLAARSGGFHFKPAGDDWVDTRSGADLMAVLQRCIAEQSAG